MSDRAPDRVRRVLLLAHTGREDAREVARAFVKALSSNDIRVRALPAEAADLALDPDSSRSRTTSPRPRPTASWRS